MIRFTPRKPRSTWSAVNIARAEELLVQGRMQPTGLVAFAARTDDNSAPSYHKTAIWWVVSAKCEETTAKRLRTLIEDSAQGRTIRQLTRP
jgi:uncharacterized protein YdeI (YjbR/CyaY-like superfamily)